MVLRNISYRIVLPCVYVFVTFGFTSNGFAAEPELQPTDPVAVWHFKTLDDSTPANSRLITHGSIELDVRLPEPQFAESLRHGGDGYVAKLDRGWFDAGRGKDQELNLHGDQFTALIRIKFDLQSQWSTRGLYTQGGGHDRLVFNFFSHDFDLGAEGMKVGCEIGIEGRSGLGGQVTAPVSQIGATDWHDLLARYDGTHFALFVDGVLMQQVAVNGRLRQGNSEPLCIGSGGGSDQSIQGWIDHAMLWDRALSDDQIIELSGGPESVRQKRISFDAWVAPSQQITLRDLLEHSRQIDQVYLDDPHRPRYHFMHFESGDIMPGDPNGAIYWKGRYHLFYIFQRRQDAPPHTVHCWGHASSVDLVHWQHHPTALDVAPNDPDRGIFSGNALVNRDGRPTLIYHGVGLGNCQATAMDDQLLRWNKSPTNPLVPIPKPGDPGFGKYDSWDPHVWLENGNYFAIFGGNPGTGAPPTLFRGPDLDRLEYVDSFLTDDRWSQVDEDVSCPDFFPISSNDQTMHLLLCISHLRGARYFLGRWNGNRFEPQSHARMNWPGGCFFAPETLIDHHGRRILWGWCLDERPSSLRRNSVGTGVMSLPRVLTLNDDGVLGIEPPPELERLRINPVLLPELRLNGATEQLLPEVSGDSLELQVEFPAGLTNRVGVVVRRSADGSEQTTIWYDPDAETLSIDVSKSSLDRSIRYRSWCLFRPTDQADAMREVWAQEAPLKLSRDEPLRLRIYIDRSILEVFANGRQCMTQRIWPTRPDAIGVGLNNEGPAVLSTKIRAWEMAAANEN